MAQTGSLVVSKRIVCIFRGCKVENIRTYSDDGIFEPKCTSIIHLKYVINGVTQICYECYYATIHFGQFIGHIP